MSAKPWQRKQKRSTHPCRAHDYRLILIYELRLTIDDLERMRASRDLMEDEAKLYILLEMADGRSSFL